MVEFDAARADRDRARWLRFALKLAALWAAVLGAVGFAVTDDVDLLWWGLRLTGALTAATGLFGLVRSVRDGRGRGQPATDADYLPSRALTGTVRVLLGTAVVVATL